MTTEQDRTLNDSDCRRRSLDPVIKREAFAGRRVFRPPSAGKFRSPPALRRTPQARESRRSRYLPHPQDFSCRWTKIRILA